MTNKLKLLVIDDDPVMRDACREALSRVGHDVETAGGGAYGLTLVGRYVFDVVILDLKMPDVDGLTVLGRIRETDPEAVIIIISGHGTIPLTVEAMKLGAFDFLAKPFTPAELRRAVERAREKRQLVIENTYLREELSRQLRPHSFVTGSRALKKVVGVVERVAPTDTTVLITGESGTGKSLLARRIHELSTRRDHPFVTVDCSTLVPTLFESEIFGHVRGSFTGAEANKIGKFEMSSGGTLFFDEVSNISMGMQAKLLKAVEERAITKVGDTRVIRVDTRLIAATNRDLVKQLEKGEFRQDLFYRLNVMQVTLPPLRERREDIPLLAQHILDEFRDKGSMRVRGFTSQAMDFLVSQDWPGNVRQLRNTLERLVVLATGSTIDVGQVAAALDPSASVAGEGLKSLAQTEKEQIEFTLEKLGGNQSQTARVLGIDRKTLRNKIRKYGLSLDPS